MMLARQKTGQPLAPPRGGLTFHAHSFADDAGRLFWWGAQLCRGINAAHAPFFARLFADGVIRDLVGRGLLVESELTDLAVDQYPLVVKHGAVPFVSYPNEWCAAMLKDAALAIVDLVTELSHRGLTLKDAHPWNLLFDGCRPVYVDLTSIVPQADAPGWAAYDEFCRFCYYPLILMAHGQERIARLLIPEYEGVTRRDLFTLLRGSAPSWFVLSKLLGRVSGKVGSLFRKAPAGPTSTPEFLKKVRRDLEKIQPPAYESNDSGRRQGSSTDRAARQSLDDLMTELRPRSVLDLSRGGAWTSTLPAACGSNVVSLSADPARAAAVYEIARRDSLPVLPLVVDFVKPTPSVGYSDHYAIAATERLKCDLVVALGLADHVMREKHFSPELIAEGLSAFAGRWLVTDFVGSESHSRDELRHALGKRFRAVRVLSSAGRGEWLVCEK